MEQTLTMEKKNQPRFISQPAKSNQDNKSVDNFKKNHSQYPRKRDYEKFDSNKKLPANRACRSGQRYVRPREKVGCQVEQKKDESEIGSLQRFGAKKQNINHLLNWWGPGLSERYSNRGSYRSNCYSGKKHVSTHIKYNKEHFLQANCQFVVISGNDYSDYDKNPDQLIDWGMVQEVRLHMTEPPGCPICLFPPIAAKITRCGHIYCYSCILHYLSLSDKKWRKCPICFEAIQRDDLRSVKAILHTNCAIGDEIELKLMRRDRDSLIPVPVTDYLQTKKEMVSISDMSVSASSYCKLIVATADEVHKHIISREIQDLELLLKEEANEPEACFIETALSLIATRLSLLSGNKEEVKEIEQLESCEENPGHAKANSGQFNELSPESLSDKNELSPESLSDKNELSPESLSDKNELSPESLSDKNELSPESLSDKNELSPESLSDKCSYEFAQLNLGDCCNGSNVLVKETNVLVKETNVLVKETNRAKNISIDESFTPEDLDISHLQENVYQNQQDQKGPKATYYFYQESSGAHVYLHAINVHMLVREYGSLEKCPHTIKAKVLEKEASSMTEEFRQRLRYLRHLPITCPFETVEIELKYPLVSQLTIAEFQEQLDQRQRKRKKKAKEEFRIEKRVRVEEDRLMGRSRGASINMNSYKHFPTFSDDPPLSSVSWEKEEAVAANCESVTNSDIIMSQSPPSFAQVISNPKTNQQDYGVGFPGIGNAVNKRDHHLVNLQKSKKKTLANSDDEEEGNSCRVPNYKLSFSDAFDVALEKATRNKALQCDDVDGRGKRTKKKKKGTIVLLSSGGL